MYKKKLVNEINALKKSPVDGFRVRLAGSDITDWEVYIIGPPDTDYECGIFKARLQFSKDYPFSPPKMKILSKFWHPNVYPDGRVCISILDTPDPKQPELAGHCWSPVQRVETILLS